MGQCFVYVGYLEARCLRVGRRCLSFRSDYDLAYLGLARFERGMFIRSLSEWTEVELAA